MNKTRIICGEIKLEAEIFNTVTAKAISTVLPIDSNEIRLATKTNNWR